jgi:hypothetical protein
MVRRIGITVPVWSAFLDDRHGSSSDVFHYPVAYHEITSSNHPKKDDAFILLSRDDAGRLPFFAFHETFPK